MKSVPGFRLLKWSRRESQTQT